MGRETVTNFKLPNLKVPLKGTEDTPTVPCFGVEWDITTRECSVCSANELCAIITQQNVTAVVVKKEKDVGYYLDQQDFSFPKETLLDYIKENSGALTSAELVAKVADLAKSRDDVAVIQYIKRLVRDTKGLSIKEKIVYYV